MKVKIETPIARLTVDLSEEQVAEILGLALDYATGLYDTPQDCGSKSISEEPIGEEFIKTPKVEKTSYKGFLYIECESCKKSKGFMPKKPISFYHCDCGHETKLEDMVEMYAECKCGKVFKYLTNATGSVITMECLNCGAPIDLEFNPKSNNYQTMK